MNGHRDERNNKLRRSFFCSLQQQGDGGSQAGNVSPSNLATGPSGGLGTYQIRDLIFASPNAWFVHLRSSCGKAICSNRRSWRCNRGGNQVSWWKPCLTHPWADRRLTSKDYPGPRSRWSFWRVPELKYSCWVGFLKAPLQLVE